jgi:hypothetical protein
MHCKNKSSLRRRWRRRGLSSKQCGRRKSPPWVDFSRFSKLNPLPPSSSHPTFSSPSLSSLLAYHDPHTLSFSQMVADALFPRQSDNCIKVCPDPLPCACGPDDDCIRINRFVHFPSNHAHFLKGFPYQRLQYVCPDEMCCKAGFIHLLGGRN